MKKFTLLLTAVLLALSTNLFAAEQVVASCDFTAKTVGNTSYVKSWTYGDWTVFGAANNKGDWAYAKFGGNKTNIANANPCYIFGQIADNAISKIVVTTNAGNLSKAGSVNEWGVNVYSDKAKTNLVANVKGGTMTKSKSETLTLSPADGTMWSKGSYYQVYFDMTNTTTTNGIVWVDKIDFYTDPQPTLTADKESIAIQGTLVEGEAEGTATIHVSGANLAATGEVAFSVKNDDDVLWDVNVPQGGTLNMTNGTFEQDVEVYYTTSAAGEYSATLNVLAEGNDDFIELNIPITLTVSDKAFAAEPTISLASGNYVGAQTVTLTCETANATIRYTLDGTEPTETSTAYTAPIVLGETENFEGTLKAQAFAEGMNPSQVVSATYSIDKGYASSIAEFIEKAPTTAYELRLSAEQEAVITGVYGASIYIQDASNKGINIRCANADARPAGAEVGKKFVGTVKGTYAPYNKAPQMGTPEWVEGYQFVEAGRPAPIVVEAIDAATYAQYPMMLVKLENVTFQSTSAVVKDGKTQTLYNTFHVFDGKVAPAAEDVCDVTGILNIYNSTPQLLPALVTDIDTKGAKAALPTFSVEGGATAEEAVEAATITITPAASTKVTVNGKAITSAELVSIDAAVKEIKVTSTRDFYADNELTVYYAGVPHVLADASVAFGEVLKTATAEAAKTLTVTGEFLTEEIVATLSEGAAFTVEPATLPAEGGTLTITPTATLGTNNATLTLTSGTHTAEVALSATILDVYTITWSDKGETTTTTIAQGDAVVLPATDPTCETKEFMGWTAMETLPENATIADIKFVTTATIPEADATYYAVFAKATKGTAAEIELTWESFGLEASYATKSTTINGIGFTVDKGFKNNNAGTLSLQMNNNTKGAPGILYNTTAIPGLESITLNVASGSSETTIYQGTSEQPSENEAGKSGETATIPFAKGMTYFKLAVSGATYFSSIVIAYTPVTYSEFGFTCPTTPSAIESAAVESKVVKTIENGQVVIIREGVKYNAMGVRLQ